MPPTECRFNQFRRPLGACLAIYWIVLLLAIHWPMPRHISHLDWYDKMIHFAIYGGLALFLSPVVNFLFPGWPAWKRAAGVVVAVVIQGGCDELTQPLTQRTTDILDLLADTCGAIAAVLIYRAVMRRMVPSER